MNEQLINPGLGALVDLESELLRQTERRRTFAIISHPDAGKTTLTEKLLLYGGAIEEAGAVKTKRDQRAATSDWMELEKQRGISITSTVLQFEYSDHCLNLVDTPGHQDFSEDTYRTLAAADNAVMLIDGAKGLEPQTRKLFEVCRLRNLPLFTLINKLDRPSKEPFELLDEIEQEFGLPTYAVNWPIGSGDQFKGVVDRGSRIVHLFKRTSGGKTKAEVFTLSLDDESGMRSLLPGKVYEQLIEELHILDHAGSSLDVEKIRDGSLTPVYFGSAANNFGIELFLNSFISLAAQPARFDSNLGTVDPAQMEFSGFVFKLQANMDPRHRDRIAFVRVCSGVFTKDMTVTNTRTQRSITLNQPKKLFARERASIEQAFPGDIIGLNNPGCFAIGDTITSGKSLRFPAIPSFAPELFAFLENREPSKYKQFHKGIAALQEEGAIQILWLAENETRYPILGAVGPLQFEVVQFRLQSEYGVSTSLRTIDVKQALWVEGGWHELNQAHARDGYWIAIDVHDEPVLLFKQSWDLQKFKEKNPQLKLCKVNPRTLLAKNA